ncbi:MAG: hypothetical protein H0X62_12760 [Bacteroidetes bacterium]|nr:hypothetical protein [Bacteroidota bacterium]
MELVSDEYASIIYDHYFNGFFLNKIPVVKKLKWREVASFRVLYGGLSPNNTPGQNQNVFYFPTDESGAPTTFGLGQMPYIEGSIGLGNVFRILRIDFVKRFTYLDTRILPLLE